MLSLGPIAFAAPWLLTALLTLPALWLLLRVLPPAPRRIAFPPVRLLYALRAEDQPSDTTPWWLVLLRLLAVALVITGLARPLYDPAGTESGGAALVLVIDDDWAAARNWPSVLDRADGLLARAERESLPVVLALTARPAAGDSPVRPPMPAAEARALVQALAPRPWPADRAAAIAGLTALAIPRPARVVWIGNGVAGPADADLAEALGQIGQVTVIGDPAAGPALLHPPARAPGTLTARLSRVRPGAAQTLWVRAVAGGGRLLARVPAEFAADAREAAAAIPLPIELRNQIVRLDIEGEASAAAVVLLDERFKRRPVGLVSQSRFAGAQPLLDELHYLDRALAPFAEVRRGTIEALIRQGMTVLILADFGLLPESERQRLAAWVEGGGVLLRFAGPRLAAASMERRGLGPDQLVPVRLRGGDRRLGGALSWTSPVPLSPFARHGPFAGLAVPGDVLVRRQVLAEPAIDLAERSWAALRDGTPIVTAGPRGEGWLVLFHTTANTAWSSLALSGLFVEMLQRVVMMSAGAGDAGEGALPPLQALDGFGRLGPPPPSARPLPPADAPAGAAAAPGRPPIVGPELPPGFYGTAIARRAVNLTPALGAVETLALPPGAAAMRGFDEPADLDLMAPLLAAALALLIADMLISLWLRGLLPAAGRRSAGPVAALLLCAALTQATTGGARAQPAGALDDFALEASLDVRLAYVLTGDPATDETSHDGLASLSRVLARRSSVEPGPPLGVDMERDELAFFVLLYWPVRARQPPLSAAAARRLNGFMRHGGTILFDTGDWHESGFTGQAGSGLRRLRQIGRALEIPPLVPVPGDHVLTKSFYLLREFPGRFTGGRVWIAEAGEGETGGEVTPVIIGAHDWAGAWARDADGRFRFPVVPGGEFQREMALRFGVNLVMYALTGNYKADQVHVPAILERLGQ